MTEYDAARDQLRDEELRLMLQRESVAAMRRDLPPGPIAKDYVFESDAGEVMLLDLFTSPDRPLVLYHFMFGGPQTEPCPMCSMWTDGWNGVADHLAANVDFALVTNGSVAENSELAKQHGWTSLRWLSAAGTSFKRDYASADDEGNQWPFITVFERDGEAARLSYGGAAHLAGDHWRGVDLLSPVWHLLDLTRVGRGDFMPSV